MVFSFSFALNEFVVFVLLFCCSFCCSIVWSAYSVCSVECNVSNSKHFVRKRWKKNDVKKRKEKRKTSARMFRVPILQMSITSIKFFLFKDTKWRMLRQQTKKTQNLHKSQVMVVFEVDTHAYKHSYGYPGHAWCGVLVHICAKSGTPTVVVVVVFFYFHCKQKDKHLNTVYVKNIYNLPAPFSNKWRLCILFFHRNLYNSKWEECS